MIRYSNLITAAGLICVFTLFTAALLLYLMPHEAEKTADVVCPEGKYTVVDGSFEQTNLGSIRALLKDGRYLFFSPAVCQVIVTDYNQ